MKGHGRLIIFFCSQLFLSEKFTEKFAHEKKFRKARPWNCEFCIIHLHFHPAKNPIFSISEFFWMGSNSISNMIFFKIMLTFTKNSDSSLLDISLAWKTKESELKNVKKRKRRNLLTVSDLRNRARNHQLYIHRIYISD